MQNNEETGINNQFNNSRGWQCPVQNEIKWNGIWYMQSFSGHVTIKSVIFTDKHIQSYRIVATAVMGQSDRGEIATHRLHQPSDHLHPLTSPGR